jgi:hypothetical protein
VSTGVSRVKKSGRGVVVPVVAAALGLLVTSGCSAGNGAPQLGGVAAEVDSTTIATSDVATLTDALCTTREATGDPQYTIPRSRMQSDLVAAMVQVAIVDEFDLGEGAEPRVDTAQLPGWDEMSDDEQEALTEFLAGDARRVAALEELGGGITDPEEATYAGQEELGRLVREEDVDVVVNPRYGVDVVDGQVTADTDLSVPVSGFAEAAVAEQVDPSYLQSLPEDQLCGVVPQGSGA